jgi:curved DNA-binding protein CbpA
VSELWDRILELARNLDQTDYYELLGVSRDAGPEAIGDAYYAKVRELHPDRHVRERDPERKRAVVRLFARVGEAHRVLGTPALRSNYDEALARGAKRLDKSDSSATQKRKTDDPSNPQAITMFKRAKDLLGRGDRKGALAQLDLARQFDPESAAIRDAIADLERVEGQRGQRKHNRAPTPTPIPALQREPAAASAPNDATSFTIRCPSNDKAISLFHNSIERQRLVLRTPAPLPRGSAVAIDVELPDGSSVKLTGTVAKTKEDAIGVRLDPISEAARAPFAAILAGPAPSPAPPATPPPAPAPVQSPAPSAGDAAAAKYQESLAMLAEALQQSPNDRELRAAFYVTHGYLEKAAGRPQMARVHFETAIALDPRCNQAKRELRALRAEYK